MKKVILSFIKLYQYIASPLLGRRCRFYPTCSEYALLAVKKYGTWLGCWKGVKRILKCHPAHPGGVDLP